MELKILDWIQALHNPVTDVLFVWITRLGNVGMIWILLAAVLLLRRKTRKPGDILAAALVVDVLLCNGLLKHLFHRVRPCDVNTAVSLLVSRPTDYSFPSGHTAASFAAVAACTWQAHAACGSPPWCWECSLLFPGCICTSITRRISWAGCSSVSLPDG